MSRHSDEEANVSDRNSKLGDIMQPLERLSQDEVRLRKKVTSDERLNQDGTALNVHRSLEPNQSMYTGLTSNQMLDMPPMTNSEMKTIGTKSISDNGVAF